MNAPTIHREFDQLTDEWLKAHIGKPTASEFKNILTPKFETRKGDMFNSYVAKKVAEAWRGKPIYGPSTFATEQGQLLEDEAYPWFALEFEQYNVERVGFITSADGRSGCSPDGIIGDDGGLELKAPQPHTHVGYLLDSGIPDEYKTQVAGSLYVSGRQWWKFVSYCRGFPALVLTMERDEEIMSKIGAALAEFFKRFDDAMARLKELH